MVFWAIGGLQSEWKWKDKCSEKKYCPEPYVTETIWSRCVITLPLTLISILMTDLCIMIIMFGNVDILYERYFCTYMWCKWGPFIIWRSLGLVMETSNMLKCFVRLTCIHQNQNFQRMIIWHQWSRCIRWINYRSMLYSDSPLIIPTEKQTVNLKPPPHGRQMPVGQTLLSDHKISFNYVRRIKATGMDLTALFAAKSTAVIFTLLTSEFNCYLITLFALWAFTFREKEALRCSTALTAF